MYQHDSSQFAHKGGCGHRGRFGGPDGRQALRNFWKQGGFGRRGWGAAQPPVNIGETDAAYTISLFAAGLVKENVTLSVKNDVLTIAYPDVNEPSGSDPNDNFTYQEYRQGPFERQFQLNNKILVDQITASYADGILNVTLPKNPETNQPAQTIPVA